jgi:YHS domain-containing protein
MRTLRYLLSTLFVLTTLAFTTNTAFAKDPIETGTFNNKAIYGYDPVAFFRMNEPKEGSDEHTFMWRGAEWHFVSEDNKNMFAADPEKWAPQYGGHCAYAMSKGRFVGIDEEAFTIYNDKLYLNYSKSVREDWLKDKDAFIAAADKNYAEETGL